MWNRKELKQKGRLAFKANYFKCVLASLLLTIITASQVNYSTKYSDMSLRDVIQQASASSGISVNTLTAVLVGLVGIGLIISVLIELFIKNPLNVGIHNFFMKNASQPAKIETIIEPFQKGHLGNIWVVLFFTDLYVTLWSLLFVVPGIMKRYEYRMVPYLLAEDSSIAWREALDKSRQMMEGQKMKAFLLDLSFIGWNILAIATGIVGILYVRPYVGATNAELYLALKDQA